MFLEAFNTPWKALNEVKRWLAVPFVWVLFYISGIKWKKGWRIYGNPILQVHRKAKVQIGENVILRSSYGSNPLAPSHPVVISARAKNSFIKIGNDFGMSGGSIVSEVGITIGNRVTVGANCIVMDSDFHPLSSKKRLDRNETGSAEPVCIGDDVFIGTNAIILKGVTIGSGSIIGAGSVVTMNIPSNSLAAGNPAKVIKSINT